MSRPCVAFSRPQLSVTARSRLQRSCCCSRMSPVTCLSPGWASTLLPVSLPRVRSIKADPPASRLNYTPRFLERLSPNPASQGQRCSFFRALSRERRLQRQVYYLHITAQTGARRSCWVGRIFHGAPVFSSPKHDSRT